MAELERDRLQSLHEDLCAGARAEGGPAPQLDDVGRLRALLHESPAEDAVPAGLVPALHAALLAAARPAQAMPTACGVPGLRGLLRMLWAEARFLPCSFFVLQAALLAMALVANRTLTGFAGPRVLSLTEPGSDLLTRALLRDALGGSVDAFTLVAPWLGLAAALAAALPGRWGRQGDSGLWADLEALSPFSWPTRLLARAAIATGIATAGTLALGLAQGSAAPMALLALARTAPLCLAVAWALAWAIPFGAPGAATASLVLWGGLICFGSRLGRWDLFAPPGTPGASGAAQAAALAAALALLFAAWALSRRAMRGPVPAP